MHHGGPNGTREPGQVDAGLLARGSPPGREGQKVDGRSENGIRRQEATFGDNQAVPGYNREDQWT